MKLKLKKKVVKKMDVPKSISVEPVKEEKPAEVIDTSISDLDRVLNKAIEISQRCSDYTVMDVRGIKMQDDLSLVYTPFNGEERRSKLSRYALSQFGSKIGVPANYLEKCVEKGRPDIAQYNVNAWIKDYEKPLFIREYRTTRDEDTIRGVLSDKYAVCDTPSIVEGIDKALDLSTFNVKGNFVSPERFHLRIASKDMMNVSGEDLFAGMSIDSSDVGRSTLRVNFLVFKQVCTNGLIISKSSTQLFHQKHIGISAEAFRSGLEEGFEYFPAIVAKVEDSIERTRNMDSPFNFDYESDEQLEELISDVRNQTSLSPIHAKSVVDMMNEGVYENNRWGYINTLTEIAQRLTLEKRLILEEKAGRLLVA